MLKILSRLLSLASLAACLFSSILYFLAKLQVGDFKLIFLVASVSWFVFAGLWSKGGKKSLSVN